MSSPAPSWIDTEKFRSEYQQRREHYIKVKAECDALEGELREMESLAARWELQLDGPGNAISDLSGMSVRDSAEIVLRDAGRPLSMDELYDTLVSRGVVIRGEDPKNTLYGTLYNDTKRLVKIGKGRKRLWGLKGRDSAGEDAEAE